MICALETASSSSCARGVLGGLLVLRAVAQACQATFVFNSMLNCMLCDAD